MPKSKYTLEENFWNRVNKKDPDECWEWSGVRANKDTPNRCYGQLSIYPDGKCQTLKAHRLSYELHYGKIPEGLHVLHKCDNPPCVNPNHLFLGSVQDNLLDASKKGKFIGKHSNLTIENIIEIKKLYGSGITQNQIGLLFGISQGNVSRIVNGLSWGSF